MTTWMKLTGILATLIIVAIIPIYSLLEPARQEELLNDYYADAVISASDLYAENCAVCHGAAGEGIADNPSLDSEAVRAMSAGDLYKVISRGRDGTLMAAWAEEEGGVLSNQQVEDFITLIQQGSWVYVAARVDELGLTPPEVIEMEISEAMLADVAQLPDGNALSEGLVVYAENCSACHGANGAGTVIAPAIDTEELRATPEDELLQLINKGVSGTLMAGWEGALPPDQLDSVVSLIYRWPELLQSGVDFPEEEAIVFPSSPELIAAGEQLFHIACQSCHGTDGYGTPMAPALNNEIFLADTPDAAIYQIIAGGIPDTLMPAWGNRLTDQDLQSLVAYLRSLESTAPSIVPPITGE